MGAATVTSSNANPVAVTGSVAILGAATVTSSNINPVVVKNVAGTSAAKNSISSFFGIDYTNITSGTFAIANADISRKGLIVTNPSVSDLYITIGSGALNGFSLTSTASVPTQYSFIIYSSGTYFAENNAVQMFHGGFFVSSSNEVRAVITEIT